MLNACATALTDRLLCRFPMAQGHRAVYVYGFELSLSSLAVMSSVFILSYLCGAVYTSITFSLIFVSIRLFSGGYHAKTYPQYFVEESDGPEEQLDKKELLKCLTKALQALSDEEWLLIQELYYLERTEREASESLHIPSSTIHDRKIAVLKKLRKYF